MSMKLPQLVPAGDHALEGAPPGVTFNGRTRELVLGDLPSGRFPVTLVGIGAGVEVTMPLTIGAANTPPAPKRRRRPAAKK